ncbi:hypothetical protein EDB89DRAFT_1624461 [Lactarius sanguifluus]|nr:hypothetical protein EDB89DRAFT_1624461 [Lactarius sanguifluus]
MAGAWPHIKSGPPDWRACFFCFYVLETVKALSPLQRRFCPKFFRASAESIGTHGPPTSSRKRPALVPTSCPSVSDFQSCLPSLSLGFPSLFRKYKSD